MSVALPRVWRTARRTHGFAESVIRTMTRVSDECGAINLSQGFPDFSPPDELLAGSVDAIRGGVNQYAITWGSVNIREALAAKISEWYHMDVCPQENLTVACGATEAMAAVLLAIVDPGDEVVVMEPFYENYGPDTEICGAKPVYAPLSPGTWDIDFERLEAAFSPKTRAVIVNTPNNPSGRVFGRSALERIAELCHRYDAYAITDEIYEHILYDGLEHVPMATLPGMAERTITLSGASKTFSVTGWRIGWIIANRDVSSAVRKVHDFLTVGAPAPLQEGVAAGLRLLPPDYYADLSAKYEARRNLLYPALVEAGFKAARPEGAYYVLADFSGLSDQPDDQFALWLARDVGVTPVPGSSFFSSPDSGRHLVRFAFCKTEGMLRQAVERLSAVRSLL